MTEKQVKEALSNLIKNEQEDLKVLQLLAEQSKKLTHYKILDGKYINKITEVIPEIHADNDGRPYTYRLWWVDVKRSLIDKEPTGLTVTTRRQTQPFNIDGFSYRQDWGDRLQYWEQTYWLTVAKAYAQEIKATPQTMPSMFESLVEAKKTTIEMLQQEEQTIEQSIDAHNKAVKTLIDLRKAQDRTDYLIRSLFPEIKLPYTTEHDLIALEDPYQMVEDMKTEE